MGGVRVETLTPTLVWQPSSLAAYYEVSLYPLSEAVQPKGKFLANKLDAVLDWVRTGETSLTLDEALTGCDYAWEVRAFDATDHKVAQSILLDRAHPNYPTRFEVGGNPSCE